MWEKRMRAVGGVVRGQDVRWEDGAAATLDRKAAKRRRRTSTLTDGAQT